MRIFGEVHQLPDLRGVEDGIFGDGHVPGSFVEQHAHGVLDLVHGFVEGEAPGLYGAAFGQPRQRTERCGQRAGVAGCG